MSRPRRAAFLAPCFALLLALSGCGEDSGSDAPEESPPAPAQDGPEAHGTPGGQPEALPTGTSPKPEPSADATELLGFLRERMQKGEGLSSQVAHDDLDQLGALLWPVEEGEAAPVGRSAHVEVARISSELARQFGRDPNARADWEKSNPVDVEIYDAFMNALDQGIEGYKRWCDDEAPALLQRFREDRMRRMGGR